MRIGHREQVIALISPLLALMLLCGVAALVTVRDTHRLMEGLVFRSLPGVMAANGLEKVILEQRGIVAAYFLDRDRRRLDELHRIGSSVADLMTQARRTAHSDEERKTIDRLQSTYRKYDSERQRAIALFEAGRTEEARSVLLVDVITLARRTHGLCQELVQANERYVNSMVRDGHRRVERLTLILTAGMVISVALGLLLLLLVIRDVLLPVRQLARDAKAFTAPPSPAAPPRFRNDLGELEFYSRALMADMDRARTKLEESQGRLRTAEKLAAVGKFAACVAHEIRNPLASMKIWLFQLQQEVSGHAKLEQPCRVLEDELRRLEDMATSFLEFSRPPELKLAPSDMGAIVGATLELAEPRLHEKELRTVRDKGPALPQVMADPYQIRQVLLNLIVNAAEATPAGGELRIVETVEGQAAGRPEVVVRVQDSGPGMAEHVRSHLFEPFVTTKPQGTGLGLSIASSIVAHHGGQLVLESSTVQGSVFALRLPASQG